MECSLKQRIFQSGWRLPIAALAVVFATLLTPTSVVTWADQQVHDWFTRVLPATPAPAQITVIDIDERSLTDIGPWPWPRPVLARLVQTLRERGARLQVWDIFIADAGPSNAALADSIDHAPDLVFGQVPVVDAKVQNPPHSGVLRPTAGLPALCSHLPIQGYFGVAADLHPAWVGHLSATPDPDGKLRQLPAVLCDTLGQYPQLALVAAQALQPEAAWQLSAGNTPWAPAQWLQRGNMRFALTAQNTLTIGYARDHTAWPAISAAQLLDPAVGLPSLKGQIVLIGASALGASDHVSTPRQTHAPGVSVHAELLGAALDDAWLVPPQAPALLAGGITLLLLVLLLPALQPALGLSNTALRLALAVPVPLLLALLGRLGSVMLPMVAPALALLAFGVGLLLARADTERKRAQHMAKHLQSFLPASLAQEVAKQLPGSDSLGKPCQGILLALRVQGLERWIGAADSLQALGVIHAISTLAHHAAQAHGGRLEHVRGEVFLLAWHQADTASADQAIGAAQQLVAQLEPLLLQNESRRFPLGLQIATDAGAFLLGVAGPQASRRPVLLGPAADVALAMLPFCEELACTLLVGAQMAQLQQQHSLSLIGQFLLLDHPQPKPLYRIAL